MIKTVQCGVNKLEYLNKKFKLSFVDILSMCQLHISLTRAAQIYLELHFCVELHTKKSPDADVTQLSS